MSDTGDPKAIRLDHIPYPWVARELTFPGVVGRGSRDSEARRVQELLCLHGYEVSVDGDFGPATEQALRRCRKDRGLEPSGQFDEEIFDHLSLPFQRAMAPIPGPHRSYGDLIARYALQHLAEHPREVGVPNGGPWVRIYMKGTQGSPWCCGFVCFILRHGRGYRSVYHAGRFHEHMHPTKYGSL